MSEMELPATRLLTLQLPEELFLKIEQLALNQELAVEDLAEDLVKEALLAREVRGDLRDQRPEYQALERMRDRFSTGDSSQTLQELADEARLYLEQEQLPDDLRLAFEWLEFSSLTWADRLAEQGR